MATQATARPALNQASGPSRSALALMGSTIRAKAAQMGVAAKSTTAIPVGGVSSSTRAST